MYTSIILALWGGVGAEAGRFSELVGLRASLLVSAGDLISKVTKRDIMEDKR